MCDAVHGIKSGQPGTSFSFVLKLKIDNSPAQKKDAKNINVFKFEKEIKVLIVEDNELNQKLASIVMNNIGCKVCFANNGKDAVEIINEKQDYFDIILMDVNMPIMNGYEATKIIREELKFTKPIIGLTANVYKEDIENCIIAGMNGHLGKPYSEAQIFGVIYKWCCTSESIISTQKKYTDLKFIENLFHGDKQVIREMLLCFITQKQQFLSSIDSALLNKSWKDIESLAHNMKSCLKNLGMETILPQVIMLEQTSGDSDGIENMKSLVDEIKEVLKYSVKELDQQVQELS